MRFSIHGQWKYPFFLTVGSTHTEDHQQCREYFMLRQYCKPDEILIPSASDNAFSYCSLDHRRLLTSQSGSRSIVNFIKFPESLIDKSIADFIGKLNIIIQGSSIH
ncbi:hypothetical protein SAMN05660330_03107 [Desulforhopalus singaporensis]|uniref:Uncharacterized protein n=1 Tax=Desulforhopalus singaporensis TaxID=91360 RepID=A0A1H0TIB1_9BACT|nr:hypothetical protein SAMN05660330_03107 [Desulforhopalus singaporensis]